LAACDLFVDASPPWWTLHLDDAVQTTVSNHTDHNQLMELIQRLASKRQYVERFDAASERPLRPIAVLGLVGQVKLEPEEDAYDVSHRISISTVAALVDSSGGDIILLDHQLRTNKEGDLEHRARVLVGSEPEAVLSSCLTNWEPRRILPLLSRQRAEETHSMMESETICTTAPTSWSWVSLILSETIEKSVLDWIDTMKLQT